MSCRDGCHLQFVRIDTPDVVAIGGEAGRGDSPDITEPEDGDLHTVMGWGPAEARDTVAP